MQEIDVKKLVQQDAEEFQLFIRSYQRYIYQLTYGVLRHEKDAEDAVQEVFIKIYHALPNYRQEGLKTWVRQISVRHAIDMKRKRSRRSDRDDDLEKASPYLADGESPIDSKLIERSRNEHLARKLQELPENYRVVIHAFYIEEKSYEEISKEHDLELSAVKMRLYRGRQWMKKNWREDEFR
ncbi:sigma-70 family RNA polymerase sigma factor [Jeotgalibacillus proteolyticus]|uniref:sigma-70 family RNA polymerase sigma factor n=1 Tax=Jeotgalibacillus proteolyticus TaxID=2082395 RepID=UPI00142F6F6F|nr:sigma-70 family RNA polymerase sigma factor [Jeotgalibacillus proteolyticus]